MNLGISPANAIQKVRQSLNIEPKIVPYRRKSLHTESQGFLPMKDAQCGEFSLATLSGTLAKDTLKRWSILFADFETIVEEHLDFAIAKRFFNGQKLLNSFLQELTSNQSPGKEVYGVYVQNSNGEQSLESIGLVNWKDELRFPKLEFILTQPKNFFRGCDDWLGGLESFSNSPRKGAATSLVRLISVESMRRGYEGLMSVEVLDDNLLTFYQSLGFELTSKRFMFMSPEERIKNSAAFELETNKFMFLMRSQVHNLTKQVRDSIQTALATDFLQELKQHNRKSYNRIAPPSREYREDEEIEEIEENTDAYRTPTWLPSQAGDW